MSFHDYTEKKNSAQNSINLPKRCEFFLYAFFLCWLGWLLTVQMCNRSDYRPCSDFRDGFHVSEQGELVCSHIHVAIESCRPCLSKVVLSLQECNSPNLQVFMCSCQMERKKEKKKKSEAFISSSAGTWQLLSSAGPETAAAWVEPSAWGRILAPTFFWAPSLQQSGLTGMQSTDHSFPAEHVPLTGSIG